MKQPIVRLKIRVRMSDGSRPYLDPVPTANGKLKAGYAFVAGRPEHHPEGSYHLRYASGGKRIWEPVGDDAQVALIEKLKRERALAAKSAGVEIVDVHEKRTLLAESIADYLTEVSLQKAKTTYVAYEHSLKLFQTCTTKMTLEALDRKDVLGFMLLLRDQGRTARTIANHITYLKAFFNNRGLTWPMLKTDKVKYVEREVSAYTKEEIRALFEVADQDETELLQFFLFTGARDLEVVYATWPDVSFTDRSFTICEKNDVQLKWKPKDGEEGTIPIPDDLVTVLRARRLRYPKTRLIFPAQAGGPDLHMLRVVKRLALRAALNCGHCVSKKGQSCETHPICERFGLHKFRKTFATFHHEQGVSARTIQRWLRHSDLDTTLRYLAASDDKSERTREQVNSTFAGVFAAP